MDWVFLIIGAITVAGAVGAMTLRNLVHCALCLAVTFVGLAALYLKLDAQFVGLAQILVYVGAVAILIVFAILLTRSAEPPDKPSWSASWLSGAVMAVAVFLALAICVLRSGLKPAPATVGHEAGSAATVQNIGMKLMSDYVLPLEAIGLLLTAALIGAVIIAMREHKPRS